MSKPAKTKQLIESVKQKSLLYDLSHVDYKNRGKKAEAWLEITSRMGYGDSKIWMAKWKSLRDNYKKYKTYQECSTTAYKKYKKWPWASQMRFLDDYNAYTAGRTTENEVIESNASNYSDYKPDTEDINSSDNESENTKISEIKKKRVKKSKISSEKSLDYFKQKHGQPHFDGVDYFFLSYAQTFKTFPARIQSILKLEMATMFARYELQIAEGSEESDSV
ncbi:uncharacterized protein LOC142979970 [Anticarsia gemmatalis]|uniref:uncharacterized protein LOC142979970 n=1 Tax=Anticarsia gemmatalis TaxID=129554 RepID=UPI003F7602CD